MKTDKSAWESSDHRSDSSLTSDIETDGEVDYHASQSKSISDVEFELSKRIKKKKILRKKKGQTRRLNMTLNIPDFKSVQLSKVKKEPTEITVKGQLSPPTTSKDMKHMIAETSKKQDEDTEVEVVITCDDTPPEIKKGKRNICMYFSILCGC